MGQAWNFKSDINLVLLLSNVQCLRPVYTIQPVVKPVVKPVWQLVGCFFTRYSRLSNGLYNRFDNRGFYRFFTDLLFWVPRMRSFDWATAAGFHRPDTPPPTKHCQSINFSKSSSNTQRRAVPLRKFPSCLLICWMLASTVTTWSVTFNCTASV